ncbi:MAG: DUF501 domain-containing protein [Actinomycetota bacterium]|nr:DUF501 domain-containing protein [Actinomycetota bacterium]
MAHRCHLGIPTVVENHPILDDGAPFPTLFWLTCPVLVKRASKQEAVGALTRETNRLGVDRVLKARQSTAAARYVTRRDALAEIDRDAPLPGGGPDRIKCLHAHVAHELADPPNPIGARALSESGWPECVVPCVERAR